VPAWGSLILLPPLLFAQPLARQSLFRASLFTRLHVVTMLLDLFDDVFLLHLALEPAQGILQRLTLLNTDFSHLEFTVLPMHVAIIAMNRGCFERFHSFKSAYWLSLLADPPTEVKLCF
jgi:hypothetical protein